MTLFLNFDKVVEECHLSLLVPKHNGKVLFEINTKLSWSAILLPYQKKIGKYQKILVQSPKKNYIFFGKTYVKYQAGFLFIKHHFHMSPLGGNHR